jgi:hypothetical protein
VGLEFGALNLFQVFWLVHEESVHQADEVKAPVIEVVKQPIPLAIVDAFAVSLLENHRDPLEDEEHKELLLRIAIEHEED